MRPQNSRFGKISIQVSRSFGFAVFCGSLVLLPAAQLGAGDWPQILGPTRSGKALHERLANHWEGEGPPLLWKRAVGRGYAGAAVKNRRAILFHRLGDEEIVEAVDLASGRPIWRQAYPAHMQPQIFPEQDGPLCVPLIDGKRVFVFGGGGDLRALDFENGKKLWQRPLYREYRTRGGQIDFGYFGAGSTPIVEGNRLLVNVGGYAGAGIVAIDTERGTTLWQATDEGASYSAPVATVVEGVRHVLFVTRYHTISIDPENGKVRFRFPFGRRGPTVNAASPLVEGNLIFTTASYGVGARLTRFSQENQKEIWANDQALSSQYNTPVGIDGYLYGTDGRADIGTGSLRCIEMKTGKIAWSIADFGVAAIIAADKKLLLVKADGELILAKPSPQKFHPLAAMRITSGIVRALPALADGRLLVRDDATMYCFNVGAEPK
jgi:outer membrane protein assembly factor BamB